MSEKITIDVEKVRATLRVLVEAGEVGVLAQGRLDNDGAVAEVQSFVHGTDPGVFAAFVRRFDGLTIMRDSSKYPVRGSGRLHGIPVSWCCTEYEWSPIQAILDAPMPAPSDAASLVEAMVDGLTVEVKS